MIDQARARIEGWTTSLLEGWGSDPLLDARDTRSCLPLPGAEPLAFARALISGQAFAFEAGMDPTAAVDKGWLRVPLATPELERRLTLMRRSARRAVTENGEQVLWLGLGMLVWQDTAGVERTSPLALWPVELERSMSGLRLIPSEAFSPRVNPALVGVLEREMTMVLALPQAATEGDAAAIGVTGIAAESFDLEALLAAAEGLAVTRPSWRVERVAKLAVVSLARHVLAAELSSRTDELAAHPVIGHLAASTRHPFAQPSIAAAEAVTRPAPAYDVLAPLDADASQLAVIAAAAQGASFVVQAAPGTGASQTIANLLVHAAASGKRVLVVSDKATALETVHARLAAVGLGEMCLPLYGAHAQRDHALGHLSRVVERTFRPGGSPSTATGVDARLGELRVALDGHVAALHASGPFGRSLHEVLGRLVELRTSANVELAERDAVGLDRATFDRRLAAVSALADAALPVEPVATHAWRLSTLEAPTSPHQPSLRENALDALELAGTAADQLAASLEELKVSVPGLVVRTREQISALGALALIAAVSPRPGAELLTNLRGPRDEDLDERVALIRARGTGTVEVPRDPLAFLTLAHKHTLLRGEVAEHFTDAVEDLDASALWAQLRKWTNSMGPLRYVALRTARAEVKTAAIPGQLEADLAMIAGLESVIAERACRTALLAAAEPARRWFGDLGGDPLALDLGKLDEAVAWAAELRRAFDAVEIAGGDSGRSSSWRALVAQVAAQVVVPSPSTTSEAAAAARIATVNENTAFARLAESVARWSPSLDALATATGIPMAVLAVGDDHLVALRERIETLRHAVDALPAWVTFHAARRTALAVGVEPALLAIERGDLGAAELAAAWERATLLAWADAEIAETPALSQFHGASHHAQVAAFADLDRGSLALARARAVVRLAEMAPRIAHDPSGEIALLLAEIKQPTRSLRAVLAALPTTLGKIAPCVLATPQAVAELLDPALPAFDLVVFDEAARLTTPMALGALSRGAAAVIIGDRARQTAATDALLAICLEAKLPELSLAWHYRSKHEDLVALANARRYADRLEVFPVAHATAELGVSLRRIGATLDRETLANRSEAEAVVADALSRLRDATQRTRSIGIIAVTATQRDLIEDLLEEARGSHPAIDAALEPGADATFEPLLVTDLAGAAGEERDVILLSIGHDASSLDHGPLTELGGDRALAAALATAREQLVVFASLGAEDVADTGAAGLSELGVLLAFAQKGGGSLRRSDEGTAASPITLALGLALADRGWTVRHQVGVGPFKLDLAVVDPSDPERFVLAIEHDGAAYARAPFARDRDRLRPAVLAQLGWRLHRLWGLDWWIDAEREVQRAHAAIVTAIAAGRQRRAPMATKPPRMARASIPPADRLASGSTPVVRIPPKQAAKQAPTSDAVLAAGSGPTTATPLAAYDGPTTPVRIPRGMIAIGPYTAAAIPAGRRTPDDLFAPRYLAEVGKIIEQVLAAEAPMHVDLLARRVGGYFGIGRLSQRVTDQVRLALAGRGRFGDEDNIVWRLDQDPTSVPPVRVAGSSSTAKRAIEEVPLSELASAARLVVERASGITTSELVRDSARLLGYARLTEQVTERITLGVRLAIARELVRVSDANKVLLPD